MFYLHTLSLFLPPPQPPLNWTGLSRKEMRSFFMAADGTLLGDGAFSPGDEEGKRVRVTDASLKIPTFFLKHSLKLKI